MTPREEHLPATTKLTHRCTHRDWDSMHKACTGSSQAKSQNAKGKWTQSPTSNQETVCNWYMMGEGKSVFSSRTASTTFNGRSHIEVINWAIQNGLQEFCGLLLYFGSVCHFGLTFVCFDFCSFLFRENKHELGRLGGAGEKEYAQSILYEKCKDNKSFL